MRVARTSHLSLAVAAGRRAAGLSQQALADRLGVSRQWVAELERGNPDAEIGLVLRALKETGGVLTLQVSAAASAPAPAPMTRRSAQPPQLDLIDELARSDRQRLRQLVKAEAS